MQNWEYFGIGNFLEYRSTCWGLRRVKLNLKISYLNHGIHNTKDIFSKTFNWRAESYSPLSELFEKPELKFGIDIFGIHDIDKFAVYELRSHYYGIKSLKQSSYRCRGCNRCWVWKDPTAARMASPWSSQPINCSIQFAFINTHCTNYFYFQIRSFNSLIRILLNSYIYYVTE